MKAVTERDEEAYYSTISKVMPAYVKAVQLISNSGHGNIFCIAKGLHTYQLFDPCGRMLTKGTLINGMNCVDVGSASKGILLLHLSDGITSWTERFIKQ